MAKKLEKPERPLEQQGDIKRQESSGIIDSLKNIYRRADGTLEDMSRIDRRDPFRSRRILIYVILILIILFGVSLAGFFLFNSSGKFLDEHISLSLKVPAEVSAGEDTGIVVTFENQEEVSLENVILTAQFPRDFSLTSSSIEPMNEARNAWSVGSLGKGQRKTLTFHGIVDGEIDSTQAISFILSYTPENFHSEFQKKATASFIIRPSSTALTLNMPVSVISEKEEEYIIRYKNASQDTEERMRITVTYPEGFTTTRHDPAPKEGDNMWEIDQVKSGQEGAITISGKLAGSDGDFKEFLIKIEILGSDGSFHTLAEKSALILIQEPQLTLKLLVNGSEEDGVSAFGTTQNYSIRYQNDSDIALEDVAVEAEFVGTIIDWSTLVDAKRGKRSGNIITWSKSTISSLARIKKGDVGEINFTARSMNAPTPEKGDNKNYSLLAKARIVSKKSQDVNRGEFTVEARPITTRIATNLMLRAEGRYYDDEYLPVGSGPLPPTVGKTTTYRVFWYVKNTTNEADNVVVRTTLPANITWTGRTNRTAGTPLAFDSTTREVTWSINKIPEHTGQLTPGLEASFEVAVTPTEADVGTVLTLTGKNTISGNDVYTSQVIESEQDSITSALSNDPLAQGKGVVQ